MTFFFHFFLFIYLWIAAIELRSKWLTCAPCLTSKRIRSARSFCFEKKIRRKQLNQSENRDFLVLVNFARDIPHRIGHGSVLNDVHFQFDLDRQHSFFIYKSNLEFEIFNSLDLLQGKNEWYRHRLRNKLWSLVILER